MKQRNITKTAQIRKKLKRKMEISIREIISELWRDDECLFIVEGEKRRVHTMVTADGKAYSIYITCEPCIMESEPFFTLYNDDSPVYATHAIRLSLLEPRIIRCRDQHLQAELELTDELLGMLIDTLYVGKSGATSSHKTDDFPNIWEKLIWENNWEHADAASNFHEKPFTISPQMIKEKPQWYRYTVPSHTPMPEYHRLLHPEMTFSEYWHHRHGDKTHEEVQKELEQIAKKGRVPHMRKSWNHSKALKLYQEAFFCSFTGAWCSKPPCEYAVLEYVKEHPINFHLPEVVGKHGIRGCKTFDYLPINADDSCDYYLLLIVNDEHHPDFFEDVDRFAKTQKVTEVYTFPM